MLMLASGRGRWAVSKKRIVIHFFFVREAVSLRRRLVLRCKLKILGSLRVFRTENQYFNHTVVVNGCERILPLEG